MAQEKKAFVVYADWESQFDLLSDEEAGKLIKHIFSYVNDKDPEFSKDERLLTMAFEPIKKQLKRDLKKYETIKIKRAEAGKKSAELRANQAQQMSTSVDFVNHISTNGNTSQQASTNSTVTDTVIVKDTVTGIVTDTVKDTDSVINNIGDSRTQNFYPTFDKQPIDSLKKNCAGHSTWLDQIGMKNNLSRDQTLEWFDAFALHLGASGKIEETEQEFKRYCASWIASEIRQGRSPITKPPDTKQNGKIDARTAMQQSILKKYGKQAN
ncbi:hypothetical protein E2P86_08055 [Sphingobacterium psychroaquaticum]|uniref:DUF6291 domain-containing protein n=1 Tax=Sphingobacterium psychroaquaticum TaxID=561061 RepID=UPI001068DD4B|nr:DUF6291 domain-containing protein [Sphingobacterium psychroaquaticum]QBQ41110.1 hypothetical protein E2P86_08055 [Sphingobacterium psychroaquaticum]